MPRGTGTHRGSFCGVECDEGAGSGRSVWNESVAPDCRPSSGTKRELVGRTVCAAQADGFRNCGGVAGGGVLCGAEDPPAGGERVADAGKVRERVLVVAVGEHLGKSEMILMELSNAQPVAAGNKLINISTEQKRAEDLVEENRLYQQTARSNGDTAMASTLDELQRILLDVANSPDEVTPAQFESIQKRIAEQGILLKVRVVRQELRAESEGRKAAPAQNDSTTKARNKA